MMRTRFDSQLSALNHRLIQMGALCETVIDLAARAVGLNMPQLANQIPEHSAQIRRAGREAEGMCMRLFLHQQPVAGDLRHISAALKMVTDMQRIGDQAEDLAEIISIMKITDTEDLRPMDTLAAQACSMVTTSVDAFVKKDAALARQVIDRDEAVDLGLLEMRDVLIRRIAQAPESGQEALDLYMTAKYFERIADHAVNLARWVQYAVTGQEKGERL